jgi:tRNA pseudouridine55 synthase
VDRLRRLFRIRRVGHTGTLDPDATGVLVVCLGIATRLAEYLSASAKHYTAEVVFGVRTDTMDASGAVMETQDASALSEPSVLALLPAFRGRIHQTPPMVSARHHEGKRLYELAREGITVERENRSVEIAQLDLTEFTPGPAARAALEVTCSTGTYIRVLADDLGKAAGVGAMMQSLRRTWVGMDPATAFTLDEAHTLEALEQCAEADDLASVVIPLDEALRGMRHLRVTTDALRRLRHGQAISTVEITGEMGDGRQTGGHMVVVDDQGDVCAIVQRAGDALRPQKVLSPL